jgi:hypothetical protein
MYIETTSKNGHKVAQHSAIVIQGKMISPFACNIPVKCEELNITTLQVNREEAQIMLDMLNKFLAISTPTELIEGQTYVVKFGKKNDPTPMRYNGTDIGKNHCFVSDKGFLRVAPSRLAETLVK